MMFFKRLFNWFKLFVAIDFIGVALFMPVSERKEFSKDVEQWSPLVIVSVIFFTIGLLLLRWFLKTRKKLRKYLRPLDPSALESAFYQNYPRFSNFIDGWSFNGFGTKYLMYSDRQADGSLYATRWLIVAFLPIVPLYRERISILSETGKVYIPFFFSGSRMELYKKERVKLSRSLIRLTYIFHFLFFLPAIIAPVVLVLMYLNELAVLLPGAAFWWIILAYFAWGIFLMFLTELWNKRLFLDSKFNA